MADPTKREAIHDDVALQGLSLSDKTQIKIIGIQVRDTFVNAHVNQDVAFLTLMNVLGSLISEFYPAPSDREHMIRKVQTFIPMYVEVYRTKEKKL